MKILRLILAAYGIIGAILWAPLAIMAAVAGGMGGANVLAPEFTFYFVMPFLAFCSYPFAAWREWTAKTLWIWGVVAHLPLVFWLANVKEDATVLLLASGLLLGATVFFSYAWLLPQSSKQD